LLLLAGINALVGACRLDAAGKDACATASDCRPGYACVAETCVAFDPGGHISAPPLMYVGGIQRHDCDQTTATYVAAQVMRRADFMQAPLIADGPAFNVTGVNQASRGMISVTAGKTAADFWFDVLVTTRGDAAAARRWRDELVAQLEDIDASCSVEAGARTGSDNETFWQGPPLTWYSEGTFATTAACDGYAFCQRTARGAMMRRGLTPGPADATSPVIVAAQGDTGITVTCADFGSYAVFTVMTSSSVDAAGFGWRDEIWSDLASSSCE